jgi:glycosyltransferase involved in cell wall biosynthesis
MMFGMPIVAPATTEMVTLVRNGVNGYVDTNRNALFDAMRDLLRYPDLAKLWGDGARATALERFSIARFVKDWTDTLEWHVGRHAQPRAA